MMKRILLLFCLLTAPATAQEVNLSCQSISAQTEVSFTTGWNSTFFDSYIFRYYNVAQSTGVNAQMVVTVSTDGGSIYASTGYTVEATSNFVSEGLASLNTPGIRANWFASVDAADTAGYGTWATMTLYNLAGVSNVAEYQVDASKYETGGNIIRMFASGFWNGSPGTLVNAVKFAMTSGTMTGKFCMSGVRKQ